MFKYIYMICITEVYCVNSRRRSPNPLSSRPQEYRWKTYTVLAILTAMFSPSPFFLPPLSPTISFHYCRGGYYRYWEWESFHCQKHFIWLLDRSLFFRVSLFFFPSPFNSSCSVIVPDRGFKPMVVVGDWWLTYLFYLFLFK